MEKVIEKAHEAYGKNRRIRVLVRHLGQLLPESGSLLDVGTGDGAIAAGVLSVKPEIHVEGLDVLIRGGSAIPVHPFDGQTLPFEDASWDYVSFIDVLHHTEDPAVLIREASRVARKGMVIKDHLLEGVLAEPTLRFMDEVGNRRFGVTLPYNYLRRDYWGELFRANGLKVSEWRDRLKIYPWWADWCFGRGLHFFARLEKVSPHV